MRSLDFLTENTKAGTIGQGMLALQIPLSARCVQITPNVSPGSANEVVTCTHRIMIGNSGRYVHIGHLSEGCVTFYELLKWNDIYDYLIDKRMKEGKGKYVGTLVVEK
ncbi:hypothetical protein [Pseudomonas chlororaphis]|uniref:hypothetical protein n=1 Tax=Pseudomonas chlororaphis TaxID=587753 RepID=UPI0015DD5E56|nr:hypothetical protein [Pseudomonas chlororaphis]QLL10549.1 hypothetical protein H0I86_26110 [Pseudomonas chlororaphis subsp. aurantiaca]